MIEAAAAGTRRRDHQTVERLTPTLIRIEAVADEFAQESGALRVAVADDPLQRGWRLAQGGALATKLQVRREIANRGETETSDRRSTRAVHRFVHASAASRPQADRAAISGQLPFVRRNRLRCLVHARAKREPGTGPLGFGNAIGERDLDSAGVAQLDVGIAHQAFNGGDRRAERQALQRAHVELPAKKRDGESLLEQETITHIPRLRRKTALLRAAQDGERLIASAVDDFEEDGAACATSILGSEEQ